MSRLALLALFVLSLQLISSTVDAGVLATADSVPAVSAPAAIGMAIPSPNQTDPDESTPVLCFGKASGLIGHSSVSSSNSRVVAVPCDVISMSVSASPCARIALQNSVLPSSPLLDDLLKPS
ncbi:hypothetical protein [Allorhodopirellula solitaria]|uniref:Secreted protein n=1 Tax=Allorhodopirellula solitaria TaxID=2527987 RepID=A0A5C5WZI3_9BACT|nr:hypothetical protein [Allorhodopirellula solitaria]TWT55335.1 hypothetical protein CA85_49620 [Allorhodopirellula solitaria]